MRASIKNYMDALKRRKSEEGDESGFSLIELIVVVVILGVLAAIAIPVFNGIQADAEKNSIKTIAANGASQVSAALAKDPTATPSLTNLTDSGKYVVTVAPKTGSTLSLENFCVTADKATGATTDSVQKSGPGC
ncbi:prepilin-type N-terminal cleavage/methylation domain-containing protein [Microbacterium sp. CJ88]|uniref:prepilin-type N-terminal cleavage/methylation domain-containing protein n=1 Tax=Microbacterium sp. CJ88 TaxID=3445672 RepID=UPI003F656D47